MPLLPAEILNKRYRIVALLSEGRYGVVYRAFDIVEQRQVAIREHLDPTQETQRRFRTAARRLSRLNHPQLAQVRDHFSIEGTGQYLISDYIDGVDLQTLLKKYDKLPSNLLIGWLQAACQPLGYLHEKGIHHLNIKPANLRLTPAGEIVLVNPSLSELGVFPAHPDGYGAPEQQAQTAVSPQSDIYSLGATLYTLLTGEVPPAALGRESGLNSLTPARERNPDIPPYLSLVAGRAMSLRADSRYDDVAAFSNALSRPTGMPAPQSTGLRRTETAVSRPTSPPPQPMRPLRRQIPQRTIVAISAILLVVLALMTGFGYANFINQPEEVTEAEATATIESALLAALTAIAPTPSPLPVPTTPPTPTPQPLITSTGSRMLYVPEGLFRMGRDDGERDEGPSRLVRLDGFFIDETEVTNAQYAQCVEAGECDPPDSPNAAYHGIYYGNTTFADYPVIRVSWYDAAAFCTWREARLPSEAEWEKAAAYDPNQGTKFLFPWGEAFDAQKANLCDSSCNAGVNVNDGFRDTAPVGSYPDGRSPLGMYDMLGNVMEWTFDWYDPRTYSSGSDVNPFGPVDGGFKSLRGGSWLTSLDGINVTTRGSFDPTVSRDNLGFRCALSAP